MIERPAKSRRTERCLVALLSLVASAAAQEPNVPEGALPRTPPRTPAEALRCFEVAAGQRVELVASEPLVRDPVALAFDARSRLYVVEMRDYSERREERLGSIRRLVDIDGDGTYDRSDLFAEDLPWPTAIACWRDGVFVGAAPHVLYLRDRDGDGRADERSVVLTGFHHTNVQGLLNGFRYGPDHRIHGATSRSGGRVRRPNDPASSARELRGRDFSFDPDDFSLLEESGGGQHGMDFDETFQKFVCSNSNHAQHVLYPIRAVARNPFVAPLPVLRDIAREGPQADVHRSSPVEPWRLLRTRWRVAGLVPGPIERGGLPSGYFTGASGLTVYQDDRLESVGGVGMLFVGDVGSNLVHRKRLSRDGLSFVAERVEEGTEFLRSSDPWFRPVTFRCGPDGTLFVADMYREVIEHPASLPPSIKERLDLTSGCERGRIYRIVPEDFVPRSLPDFESASSLELVAFLDARRTWSRTTALRLLRERSAKEVAPTLRARSRSFSAVGRIHALSALAGLEALEEGDVRDALEDEDARVRAFCLEWFPQRCFETRELEKLAPRLAADPDPLVRHRLALAAAFLPRTPRIAVLARIARLDDADELIRQACSASLAIGDVAPFVASCLSAGDPPERLLHEIVPRLLEHGSPVEVDALLAVLEASPLAPADGSATVLEALVEGSLRRRPEQSPVDSSRFARVAAAVSSILRSTLAVLADREAPLETRRRALNRARFLADAEALPALLPLLDPKEPLALQEDALTAIGLLQSKDVADALIVAWPELKETLRGRAAQILVTRATFAHRLLEALEASEVRWNELARHVRERLENHPSEDLRGRARALARNFEEPEVTSSLERLEEARRLAGDAVRGRESFRSLCASCHQLGALGTPLGPDLRVARQKGRQALLLAIVHPNREVDPRYVEHVLEHEDGRILNGILAEESEHSLTLLGPNGAKEVVSRRDVHSLRSTGRSSMPERLLDDLDVQAVADLLRFLEEGDSR